MDRLTAIENSVVWTQLWQLTAVLVAVGIATALVGKKRPHLAYALWLVALLKCLTPPIWYSPLSVFSWRPEITASPSAPGDAVVPAAVPPAPFVERSPDSASSTIVEAPSMVAVIPTASRWPRLGVVLSATWIAGAVFIAVGLAAGRWLIGRKITATQVATEPWVESLAQELSERLSVRRRVRVVTTTAPLGPAVFGTWRVTLLLPATLVQNKTREQLEPILAHELIHARRGDTLWGSLQLLAQVVWWFHPLVWWANRAINRTRERCCDLETLAGLGCKPAVYARCFLDVAESKQSARPILGFLGMRHVDVTRTRLEQIMSFRTDSYRRSPVWFWVIFLLATALVLPGAQRLASGSDPKSDASQASPPASPAVAKKEPFVIDTKEELDKAVSRNYAILPVTTELQRSFDEANRGIDAYVLINGPSILIENDALDAKGVDLEEIRQRLSLFSNRKTRAVQINVYRKIPKEGPDAQRQFLSWTLRGLGQSAEFAKTVDSFTYSGRFDWREAIEDLQKRAGDELDGEEKSIGNDLVKIYPVRTRLTRFLSGSGEIDVSCIVEIVPNFGKESTDRLAPPIRQSILEFVPKAVIANKEWIQFRVATSLPYREVDKFMTGEAKELARLLGFVDSSVSVRYREQ